MACSAEAAIKIGRRPQPLMPNVSELPLPALLSKVLLAIAIEFERESEVSLAICANVLRFVGEESVRVRDLPLLSGVSKEAIAASLNFLQKRGYAAVKSESPGVAGKGADCSPQRDGAPRTHTLRVLATIEERWQARLGEDTIRTLRESLERFVGEPTQASPCFAGWSPIRTAGELQSPGPRAFHTTPWCCTAAGSPTAADCRSGAS